MINKTFGLDFLPVKVFTEKKNNQHHSFFTKNLKKYTSNKISVYLFQLLMTVLIRFKRDLVCIKIILFLNTL